MICSNPHCRLPVSTTFYDRIRATVPRYADDRPMMTDIEAMTELVRTNDPNM